MIDDSVKEMASEVLRYAEKHVYTMDDMLDIVNGDLKPPGDEPGHVMEIPFGYRVVFSLEQQNVGLCRHLSVSVAKPGKLPSIPSVQEIMNLFNYERPLTECLVRYDQVCVEVVEPITPSK